MVRGLDVFKNYFERFPNNYVIIGGTACDIIIDDAGFIPRTTKDIDVVLVVEALSSEFVNQFWKFIRDGNYQQREKGKDEKEYYRFIRPANPDFPHQIELFSRTPDVIVLDASSHLTPIPVDEGLLSLSAILLNDDYYHYIIQHSQVEAGLHYANIEALICLKAKAYLEIKERIENGRHEDAKHLRKHKTDVFWLTLMLSSNSEFELPKTIQDHVNQFAALIAADLPDRSIFNEMGFKNIDSKPVFDQFKKSFKIGLIED